MFNSDLISGVLVMAVAILAYFQSNNLSYHGGVFVWWIVAILGVLGLALTTKGLVKRRLSRFFEEGAHRRHIFLAVIGLSLYVFLLRWTGFLLTSTVAFTAACVMLTPGSTKLSVVKSIGIALSITVLFYAVFRYGLLVPLPVGRLFQSMG